MQATIAHRDDTGETRSGEVRIISGAVICFMLVMIAGSGIATVVLGQRRPHEELAPADAL